MKLTKTIPIFFLLMFLLTIINAQPYEQNQDIEIIISCENLNCSGDCFLTLVAPNSTKLIYNENLSIQSGFANATTNQTQALGQYDYFVDCDGIDYSDSFKITPSGTDPSTAQGIIYAILLIAFFLFMGLCFYGSIVIDGKNEFKMGKLIKINYNKYIKQGLWFIGYLFLIFTVFIASEISQNFLDLGFASTVLNWLHIFLWIAFVPIFFIFITFNLIKWMADLELMDLAKRNLKPYGT